MRVDPPGRDRKRGKIVGDRVGGRRAADARDLRSFDHDDGVVQRLAFSIEDGRRFQTIGRSWANTSGRAEQQETSIST